MIQRHVMENGERWMPAAKRHALRIAHDGLDAAYAAFEFIRDGKTLPFSKAMAEATFTGSFKTHIVRGEGPALGRPYFLGLQDRGRLEGLPLKQRAAGQVSHVWFN